MTECASCGQLTDSRRHERAMVRAIATPRGFRPGLTLEDAELARIEQPTLHVFGTADPVGSVATWRRPAGLLPRGELVLVDDAGHVPWFDDPRRVATSISRFLDRRRGEDHGGHSTSQPQ